MAGVTSGTERNRDAVRALLHFGRIIVVGGGCYGSYYVRQLARARGAGAIDWSELVVADRNPDCAVTSASPGARPAGLRVAVGEWRDFFDAYLSEAASAPDLHASDAIVPSPLMPHLMAQWIVDRARRRWPNRAVSIGPVGSVPDIPWQRPGDDGTHYVSFAEWMCPINCIEPVRCPATKGERTWSMPPALQRFAEHERSAGREMGGPFVFHCTHRAYGVGMIDVRDVLAADAAIAQQERGLDSSFLIGTASHCHGALQRLVLGA
jgi:hypothetical protein